MSTASQGFWVPPFDRVEFHADRMRAALVATAALLAGAAFSAPALTHWSSIGNVGELFAAAMGICGGCALLGAGVSLMLQLLLRRGPIVVIDTNGIHDRRTGSGPLPWSHIQDIRPLDRDGRHIGIETCDETSGPHCRQITVIDTFFLRAANGNRALDFILPITAMAPIDMSETPLSAATLAADRRLARRRILANSLFVVATVLAPGAAGILLVMA